MRSVEYIICEFEDYDIVEGFIDCKTYSLNLKNIKEVLPILNIEMKPLMKMLREYGNVELPYNINNIQCNNIDFLNCLISPQKMSDVCKQFLENKDERNLNDLRYLVQEIKKISDKGKYVFYNNYWSIIY